MKPLMLVFLSFTFFISQSACMDAYIKTIKNNNREQPRTRIYLATFELAWGAVLNVLKNSQMDITNREGGFIQTKWLENTAEKNFIDAFGSSDLYLKAQYRFRVSVSKGYFNGKPSVKVSVEKEQITQKDVLEGWRHVESDGVEEENLLYRIGRVILLETKLTELEIEKAKQDLLKEKLN